MTEDFGDHRNWSTSAAPSGGTPGWQNSLYAVSIPPSASLAFSPNPFSPDGDGYEDVTLVSYYLPTSAGVVRVRVYDSRERLVRILADRETSGSGVEMQAARGLVVVAAKI